MHKLPFEAAMVMITRTQRLSSLKSWAVRLAARKGLKKAMVAAAGMIAIVLHRIWRNGTTFAWRQQERTGLSIINRQSGFRPSTKELSHRDEGGTISHSGQGPRAPTPRSGHLEMFSLRRHYVKERAGAPDHGKNDEPDGPARKSP